AEDGIREGHVTGVQTCALPICGTQRYLKVVRYANTVSYYPDWSPDGTETLLPPAWHCEVVVDYGDHDQNSPAPTPERAWPVRPEIGRASCRERGARSGGSVRLE